MTERQNKTSQRVLRQLIHWRTNNVTTTDQEEHKLKQIYIWNPWLLDYIM